MDDDTRRALQFVRDQLVVGEARLHEHMSAGFRWLMATLFTANGGALVALIDADLPGQPFASAWFAIGVILSLLMGALSTFQSFRYSQAIIEVRRPLEEALLTGEADPVALRKLLNDPKFKFTWKTWFPTYTGLASLALFVIGIGTIAGSILRQGL
jgi:hypothetical protein